MKEIEDFLRENKPAVKNNPTFILEARRRMEAVEGIKAEVDRQHKRGRVALIIALVAGLVVGVVATAIAFLYPVDPQSVGEGVWQSVRLFLQNYRQYLLLPVAVLAMLLALVLSRKGVLAS
jgi:type IV secretory pathway component VirB8